MQDGKVRREGRRPDDAAGGIRGAGAGAGGWTLKPLRRWYASGWITLSLTHSLTYYSLHVLKNND